MWSDQWNQGKKNRLNPRPSPPSSFWSLPVSKLVEQSQTGQWEGLGMKLKNNCLWPSCPHSKTTWQPRNPLSFSLATRCFHCSTAFNCFHNTQEKLFMGSVLVESYTTVFCLHLLNVLKFPLIYPLASYLCVCCGACMCVCVCVCVFVPVCLCACVCRVSV